MKTCQECSAPISDGDLCERCKLIRANNKYDKIKNIWNNIKQIGPLVLSVVAIIPIIGRIFSRSNSNES